MSRSPSLVAATLVLGLLSVPAALDGQSRPQGWPPASAGFRAGYDYNSTGSVVGLQLRLPVLPSGFVEVVPNGEMTFLTGLREVQGGVDVVFVSGGRRGGLYAGGGVGWRNTLYEGPERETRLAPTLVAGARSSALFGPV
ncbi:MAG TPA: hypothetical protein VLA43_16035, partial [Longimicrobiales bacterium]|nr:hypothetical protein [Longimicrobiales bacterium]